MQRTRKPSPTALPRWFIYSLITVVLVSALTVTTLAYWTVEAVLEAPLNPLEGGQGFESIPTVASIIISNETPTPVVVQDATPTVVSESEVIVQAPPTEVPQISVTQTTQAIDASVANSERITVLVMGIDRRPGEPFISLTDSMMLLSINPQTQRASMMSIPRDFYAQIPGYGRSRINTAFLRGASGGGGPAAGARLAMDTVSFNLGVHVNHYILVDFGAFINAIDAVGGIEVDVPKYIWDPTYPSMNYGYDPLEIQPGLHVMDGELALKYARTRHVDSDFGRAERQQQVALAVRDKVIEGGINNLIFDLPVLYQQLEEGIRTDLSITQMYTLASAATSIPSENISTVVLDYNYFSPYMLPDGAQVLILNNYTVGPVITANFTD